MSSILASMKRTREWATPTLKSSAFLTRGVLTPEEFVKAGDELVYKCPTWSWESGDPKKTKSYLPKDKQYLVTRGVPCQTRVSSLEGSIAADAVAAGENGEDDWLVSNVLSPAEQERLAEKELEDGFDIIDDEGEVVEKPSMEEGMANMGIGAEGGEEDDDDEEEYADMADFEDDNVVQDEAAVVDEAVVGAAVSASNADQAQKSSSSSGNGNTNNDNLVRTRTYDLSITYDKYYQTPRVWMRGYDDISSRPLTGDEMMEDVYADYARRTVTVEDHPHVTGPHASIHPCKHGDVMKTIVRNLTSGADVDGEGGGPSVETYLFIFLKFVSSIIPTMNYDFTMDVTASTRKS